MTTRILFVDDEPALLRAFERGLLIRRRTEHAMFATSGEDALALLERESVDVVISDAAMPGMCGIALLERVRERFPQLVRIVLSGNLASSFADPRAFSVVHQWLAKPCSMAQLCATLDRLAWARSLGDDPAANARVLGIALLPVGVRERVAAAETVAELAAVVATDPALAAKVLQLANSGLFDDAPPVTRIDEAVATVGAAQVRAIAAASPASTDSEHARHACRVADHARRLAPPGLAEDAFCAGLLHGIGHLLDASDTPATVRLGGMLLATWQLPLSICRAVALHVDAPATDALADVVARAHEQALGA